MKKTIRVLLTRCIIVCLTTLGFISIISCSKNQVLQKQQIVHDAAPKQEPEPSYIRNVFFTRYEEEMKQQFANYFANPVHISKAAVSHDKRLAVVAGKRALFYPGAKISQQKDVEKLKKPTEVPFGTLLPIFAEIKTQEGSTFFHDDYYHYFYETEYEGKRGLVFGADLFGMDKAPEVTFEAWRIYTNGYGKELTPFAGFSKLPDAVIGMIEDLGIAYLPVKDATYLSNTSTGSLLRAMYEALVKRAESGADPVSLFVTADLIIDAYYEMALSLETRVLPIIELPLIRQFLQETLKYFSRAKPKDSKTQSIHNKAIYFLQTAELLIATIPEYIVEFDTYENKEIVKKKINSKAEIFSQYPDVVQRDAENLIMATGDWYSEIFEATINTNQSGNEAKNIQSNETQLIIDKILTWLSLASLDINAIVHYDTVTFKNRHGTIAWILYLLTGISENQKSLETLTSLLQAQHLLRQRYQIMISKDFVQFLNQEKLTPISTWIQDPTKTLSVINLLHKKYKDSFVTKPDLHNSLSLMVSQEKKKLSLLLPIPKLEEAIFSLVAYPRIPNKTSVSGLDILNCLANFSFLTVPSTNKFPELKKQYEAIRANFFNSASINIQNISEPIRSLITLKQECETNQPYSQTPGWTVKTALTNLACLTLSIPGPKLAVSQNSPLLLTNKVNLQEQIHNLPARIDPIRPVAHWLEPRKSLYQTMQSTIISWKAILNLAKTSDSSLIADVRNKAIDETQEVLDIFNKLLAKCELLAQKELSGEKLISEESTFILQIPQSLATMLDRIPKASAFTGASLAVQQENAEGNDNSTVIYDANEPTLFIPSKRLLYRTKNENGITELYAGLGIPYIVYIPIVLPDGTRFIATGFIYSYLEFNQSVGSLTETEWQNIVFSDEANMYKLEWE